MAQPTHVFDDSAGYERFMGRWSRAVAPIFLEWVAMGPRANWLDVGCGTGTLAATMLQLCEPASVHAIDSSPDQIAAAAAIPATEGAQFQVADAGQLPFARGSFDVVASALVINFIPDRPKALAEMLRVTRPGGVVAGFVWDFAEDLSPSGPLRVAMRRIGIDAPPVPGTDESRLDTLQALFEAAGFEQIETRTIDVCLAYQDFQDFWLAQTPGYAPLTKMINTLGASDRLRLRRAVGSSLPRGPGGVIEYHARANAVKARVPAIDSA